MNKNEDITSKKKKSESAKSEDGAPILGRKRDHTLDTQILEAAIHTLADSGFDGMTMDEVAARAKTGKASVYRRWASKAELVRDALILMSRSSLEIERVPDTGALRSDLLALVKPYSLEQSERKLRVLAGLGTFFSEHQKLADEALAGIFTPWTEMNMKIMQRAQERGEISPHADLDMASQVIVSVTSFRSQTLKQITDRAFFESLFDNILLPALKHGRA